MNEGGFGHAVWCNYPTSHIDNRGTFCNCGITDILLALKESEDEAIRAVEKAGIRSLIEEEDDTDQNNNNDSN